MGYDLWFSQQLLLWLRFTPIWEHTGLMLGWSDTQWAGLVTLPVLQAEGRRNWGKSKQKKDKRWKFQLSAELSFYQKIKKRKKNCISLRILAILGNIFLHPLLHQKALWPRWFFSDIDRGICWEFCTICCSCEGRCCTCSWTPTEHSWAMSGEKPSHHFSSVSLPHSTNT